jgi:plasmid maintenance system antidote protein VapI
MSNQDVNRYEPDVVTPPGVFLLEKLNEIGMSRTDLASRIGRARKTVDKIIAGKAPIEPETSRQLERVLGIPARFWNNAERQYRERMGGSATGIQSGAVKE